MLSPDAAETRTADPNAPQDEVEETTRELAPGTSVYQYRIVSELGRGGMGVVYVAEDMQLGRQIALKILRTKNTRTHEDVAMRLKREAQALAQLSHPNVVHVYEVGEFEGNIYLAMELVRGPNVRNWLRTQNPSRAAILDVFIQAGRGLAAAHSAGLIHRDFKPDNVIVGDDGRARVLDFGLARANRDASATTGEYPVDMGNSIVTGDHQTPMPGDASLQSLESLNSGDRPGASLLYAPLTRGGSVQGTPAYMSPEQFLGEAVDGRADQYAFCTALFEALCGYRPIKASSLRGLRSRAIRGKFEPFPSEKRIPRHIQRALLRGLTRDPEERFPDMDTLVREFERDPAARIRRIAVLVALAVVIAVVSSALAGTRSEPRDPCERVAERIDQVWNDATRTEMSASFLASERSHARATSTRTRGMLDQYATGWATMRVQACEATHVRGEQSEALLDLRMQCLDRRLAEMSALVTVLSDNPGAEIIDEAIKAVYGLPSLDLCADAEALRATMPLPADPELQQRLVDLQEQLATVQAQTLAGSHQPALELAEQVVADARAIDYPPFFAEAVYLAGILAQKNGAPDRAEKLLMEAARASARAGDDRLSAEIWIALILPIGHSQARFDEATRLGQVADAELIRAGDQPLLRAHLDTNLGTLAFTSGKIAEAYARHQRALEIRRTQLDQTHPDVIESLANVGATLYKQGRFASASDINRQALDLGTRVLGANHPTLAQAHLNLGVSLAPQGKYREAREHYEIALEIVAQVYGDTHWAAGFLHFNLGELAWLQRRYRAALAAHQKARAILETEFGREHPFVAFPLTGLGQVHIGMGQPAVAIGHLTRAKELRAADDVEPAERAITNFYLQRASWLAGERTPAVRAEAAAAFAIYNNNPYHIEAEATLMKTWLDSLPVE